MKLLFGILAATLAALFVFALRPALDAGAQAIEHHRADQSASPSRDDAMVAPGDKRTLARSSAESLGDEVLGTDPDAAVAAPPPAALRILLEDSLGKPLSGYPLIVDWRKGWGKFGTDTIVTDEDGRARTTVLAPHQIEGVRCRHPDKEVEVNVLTSPLVTSHEDPLLLRLRIAPIVTQMFLITNERGAPVEGASLKIEPPWIAAEDPTLHHLFAQPANEARTTDANGVVAWDLSAGYWSAELDAPGYSGRDDVLFSVAEPALAKTVTFQLSARRVVSNRQVELTVVLPEGGSRPEFRLVFDRKNAEPLPSEWTTTEEAVPDGSGFRLRVPEEGRWILRGKARGCADLQIPIPPQARHIVAEFDPRPMDQVVLGAVVSAVDGSPLQARVSLHHGIKYSSSEETASGSDGLFRFDYRFRKGGFVRAEAKGYAFSFVGPLNMPLQDPVVIRLHPAVTLAGRAVDMDGEPVEGSATLHRSTLQWDQPGSDPGIRIMSHSFDTRGTGKEGMFSFDDVPEGPLRITFHPKGGKLPTKTVDTAGGISDLKITIRRRDDALASLRGRATHARTGAPLADVQISFGRWPDGSSWSHMTDKDGWYEIHSLPPGERTIHAAMAMERPIKYVPVTVEAFDLRPGDNLLNVSLQPSTKLHLQVVDAYGIPVRRAWIRGRTTDGQPLYLQEDDGGIAPDLSTDAIGRLDIYGVPDSPVRLLVGRERDDHMNSKAVEFNVDPHSTPGRVINLQLMDR